MIQGTQSHRWDGEGGGEARVCLRLIHVDVQQKPPQCCKAIILQLKIKFKLKNKTIC